MSVSHLTQLGIVNGITETTFSPNKEVTRAEFAKMLSLMAGANLSASHGVTPFNDVEANAWYAPAAQWVSDRGRPILPRGQHYKGRSGGNALPIGGNGKQ